MDALKILVLDIEWRPTKAYVWQPWKENIIPEKIIEHGGLLCVGVKWFGEKGIECFSEWRDSHAVMLQKTYALLEQADAVVTYNGDKYDLRKLEGEFLLYGLPPLPLLTSIDCIKAVKRFGFFMNRLGFVAPFLGLGGKLEHEGMGLWIKVLAGDERSQKKMERYCKQDVRILEKLYRKIKPYIANHPALRALGEEGCPSCHSKRTQRRGFRFTRYFRIQRHQCQNCGNWFSGKRKKVA